MGVGTFIVLFFSIALTTVFIVSTPCKINSWYLHILTGSFILTLVGNPNDKILSRIISFAIFGIIHSLTYSLTHSFTHLFPHLGIIILILFFAPRSNKFSYSIYEPHHYDSSVIPRIAVGSMMILFTVLTHSLTHLLTHSFNHLLT